MKKILIFAIVLASLMYASSASALGEKEKNVLAVLGGILMVDKIADHYKRKNDKDVYNSHFEKEKLEVERAYMEGVARRQREELEAKKHAAYRCGYDGICE